MIERTNPVIRLFRNLKIYGNQRQVESLVARLEQLVDDGWSRAHSEEGYLRQLDREGYYIFSRQPTPTLQGVALFLEVTSYGMWVGNIVPEREQLCSDEYNAILVNFFWRFIDPAASELKLHTELSSPWKRLRRRMRRARRSGPVSLYRRLSHKQNPSARPARCRPEWAPRAF